MNASNNTTAVIIENALKTIQPGSRTVVSVLKQNDKWYFFADTAQPHETHGGPIATAITEEEALGVAKMLASNSPVSVTQEPTLSEIVITSTWGENYGRMLVLTQNENESSSFFVKLDIDNKDNSIGFISTTGDMADEEVNTLKEMMGFNIEATTDKDKVLANVTASFVPYRERLQAATA